METQNKLIRQAFERWIANPPYEQNITRFPDDESIYPWPGHYQQIETQLAWEAWQEAASHNQTDLDVADCCTTLEQARDLIRRREKATIDVCLLADPIMRAWAKSSKLKKWNRQVESLIGTAYPAFYNHPILPDMTEY